MKTYRVREAQTSVALHLTDDEADKLRVIGAALASQSRWWGSTDDVSDSKRTVIQCTRTGGGHSVYVANAIGVLGLGSTQIVVEPKIPLPHLLFLLEESSEIPRDLLVQSNLSADEDFLSIIASWFMSACETLLRRGLASDYARITADIPCARGSIHAIATLRAISVGRPLIRCDYDVRTEDTPLNRIMRAAALRLLGWPGMPDGLRKRCTRVAYRLSGIGDLRAGDLRTRPDTLTQHYSHAHRLARMILVGTGLSLHSGSQTTWTFLWRTPEAVESGLRAVLQRRLAEEWSLDKKRKTLSGSHRRTLNPDLVFGGDRAIAVGDVKYKHTTSGQIARTDLNQITTFATGYGVSRAAVVAFGPKSEGEFVQVGGVRVNGFNWNTDQLEAPAAADALSMLLGRWLAELASPVQLSDSSSVRSSGRR